MAVKIQLRPVADFVLDLGAPQQTALLGRAGFARHGAGLLGSAKKVAAQPGSVKNSCSMPRLPYSYAY